MKTDLYYFSATGNSLWVAREIAQRLESANISSIPEAITGESGIQGEAIGIVCPIYMHNIPHIVADFIGRITHADYLFFVLAGAGEAGNGIKRVRNLFQSQHLTLSALFNVPMPSNYTPFGATSPLQQAALIAQARKVIDTVAETVRSRNEHIDSSNSSFFETHIHPGLIYRFGYPRIPMFDSQFFCTDDCNGCGICGQVCPVNNITLTDDKPVWNHACQFCFACLNWCPQEAIQSGKNTVGVKRYHHPDVTLKDIIEQSGKTALL